MTTHHRLARLLLSVDAPLGHLPCLAGKIDTACYKNVTATIEEHDSDSSAVSVVAMRDNVG